MKKGNSVYAAAFWCTVVLILADPVWAGSVHIGGSNAATRIIIDLKVPVSPEVSRENRTLIVNFPDTVADPQTLSNQFMIENLAFDGMRATITIKEPFTYQVVSQGQPPRFILNLSAGKEEPVTCPIKRIDAVPSKGMMRVSLYLGKEGPPKVRTSRHGKVFLQFPRDISCGEVQRLLSAIPQLRYEGTLKMQEGYALCLSVSDKHTLVGVRIEDHHTRIILEIGTSGGVSPGSRLAMARSFSESGNVAGVISTLEPSTKTLNVQEKILLARAYWSKSYPYRMGNDSAKAVSLMNEALRSMAPGIERERLMLEYCSMLIKSDRAPQALEYIMFLKDSAWGDIAAEAVLREIDILNRKRAFQDAYVANRRMLRDFRQETIPARLHAFALSIQGDTYLGLSDYPKALSFYKQALSADAALIRSDPGLPARMADAAYNMNDYALAKGYIMQAVNLGDQAHRQRYLLMLGDCLYQLGEKDRAIVIFSQVENIARKSDSGVIAQLKAARIMLEKDTDERGRVSDKTFNKVMDIYASLTSMEDTNDPSLASLVKVRIAQAYAKHGDWDRSLDAYRQVWLETKKTDPIHHYAQAEAAKSISQRIRLLFHDSRYEQIHALYARYQDSFMKEFSDPEILFIIGFSLDRTGHKDMARSVLASSVKGDSPTRDQALSLLFAIDEKMGNHQEALTWNTLYLNAYPQGKDAPVMRGKRGEVLYLLGNLREAMPYLETSANKGGQPALTSLSYLCDAYRRLSMPEKETQTLEKIISYHGTLTSPVIEEALYLRASQLKRSGEFERAGTLYQDMLTTYPRSKRTHWAMYHLAQVQSELGDFIKAKGLLTNVTRLSSDPILLAAARTAADDMDLRSDMEAYGFLKKRSREK
ncbi:MAG: tetratricopeptide repeat protein [Deltaproteobacteria bacterium]|nr:tetratricopeptide repeat protein [Deltaproteobacteria bacterium]